jgi:hypothetical protein
MKLMGRLNKRENRTHKNKYEILNFYICLHPLSVQRMDFMVPYGKLYSTRTVFSDEESSDSLYVSSFCRNLYLYFQS